MPARTRAGILVLVLAQGLTGCDQKSSTTGPSTTGPSTVLAVLAVHPPAGLAGDTILISGTGFSAGATVMVGGVPATNVSFSSSVLISATVPAKTADIVDVVVSNANGQSAKLERGYAFQSVTLTVSSTQVTPGSQLSVSWVAPAGRSGYDWLGLFRLEDPNTSYENGWWAYTSGAPSGTRTLSAPAPGQYEFRYLLDDGYSDVARSAVVTVSP